MAPASMVPAAACQSGRCWRAWVSGWSRPASRAGRRCRAAFTVASASSTVASNAARAARRTRTHPGPGPDVRKTDTPHSSASLLSSPRAATPVALPVAFPRLRVRPRSSWIGTARPDPTTIDDSMLAPLRDPERRDLTEKAIVAVAAFMLTAPTSCSATRRTTTTSAVDTCPTATRAAPPGYRPLSGPDRRWHRPSP